MGTIEFPLELVNNQKGVSRQTSAALGLLAAWLRSSAKRAVAKS